ncbi:glycosyltransferase family 2 protein [Hansschlegelia plantiphila]|uniref:Succinoglycan biosynthesis protein ExoM n=1 Tax=Hansschlegelia plantiphila TaxID=374655 RepID=A0A9W6J337_9HYPH|nr:glycosyltransferase family 2 protein [Hansschlegelia plantiphila]GLK68838.1 succinoglycan biosynthesis protein ExoM [Hansschlegelia plantiphila]
MALELAVVICTYERPEPLARALGSLFVQRVPPGLRPTIVVADNSDGGSAEAVVQRLRAESPFEIIYVQAHPANISVARNAGIAASASPAFAFIDDDQEARDGWLEAVAEGLAAHPHDIFLGRVGAVFEDPSKATDAMRNLFSRELDGPAGLDLFAMGPQKTPGITLATNNSVFRRAATITGAKPFDPAFGQAGGEDLDLFCRLQARGVRFGWLPEARVLEYVPARRCEAGYLNRRFYAGGQAYAAAVARSSRNPALARWTLRIKAAAQAVLLACAAPAYILRGRAARADYAFRWAGVLGKLSFGALYPIYREDDAARAKAA